MQKVTQANAKQRSLCLNIPLTFSRVCTQSVVCIAGTRCFMSQHADDRKRAAYHKRCEHLAINRKQIQSALEERSSHHPAGHTVGLNEKQANIINTFGNRRTHIL